MYTCIRPGKHWYDTEGKLIQAHGGSVIREGSIYYWYGENKEGITGKATGDPCRKRHGGVRLYSSNDLYNWRDEGIILISDNPANPFYPGNIMERPHILYNAKTGNYVLWAKCGAFSLQDRKARCFAVATAESIKGPYRLVNEIRSGDFSMGDFDLVEDGGKAYVIFEQPHTEMLCITLNDDYTGITGERTSHLFYGKPPFTREAPCFFQHGGRRFLITSGTTGYYPNPTLTYEIHDMHGEWELIGSTCEGDVTHTSFQAQFSCVFYMPGADCWIAAGDRWLTDLTFPLPDIPEIIQNRYPAAPDFDDRYPDYFHLSDLNTSMAGYVWLPILFGRDGVPRIRWQYEWRIPDADKKGN